MRSSTIIQSRRPCNQLLKNGIASPRFARRAQPGGRLVELTYKHQALLEAVVGNFFRGFGAVFTRKSCTFAAILRRLFFSLVIPLLQMVVLGFGIDTNIRQINTCGS